MVINYTRRLEWGGANVPRNDSRTMRLGIPNGFEAELDCVPGKRWGPFILPQHRPLVVNRFSRLLKKCFKVIIEAIAGSRAVSRGRGSQPDLPQFGPTWPGPAWRGSGLHRSPIIRPPRASNYKDSNGLQL